MVNSKISANGVDNFGNLMMYSDTNVPNDIKFLTTDEFITTLTSTASLSDNQVIMLPDKSGTIALLSDITTSSGSVSFDTSSMHVLSADSASFANIAQVALNIPDISTTIHDTTAITPIPDNIFFDNGKLYRCYTDYVNYVNCSWGAYYPYNIEVSNDNGNTWTSVYSVNLDAYMYGSINYVYVHNDAITIIMNWRNGEVYNGRNDNVFTILRYDISTSALTRHDTNIKAYGLSVFTNKNNIRLLSSEQYTIVSVDNGVSWTDETQPEALIDITGHRINSYHGIDNNNNLFTIEYNEEYTIANLCIQNGTTFNYLTDIIITDFVDAGTCKMICDNDNNIIIIGIRRSDEVKVLHVVKYDAVAQTLNEVNELSIYPHTNCMGGNTYISSIGLDVLGNVHITRLTGSNTFTVDTDEYTVDTVYSETNTVSNISNGYIISAGHYLLSNYVKDKYLTKLEYHAGLSAYNSFAKLSVGNNFAGNQTIIGDLEVTGNITINNSPTNKLHGFADSASFAIHADNSNYATNAGHANKADIATTAISLLDGNAVDITNIQSDYMLVGYYEGKIYATQINYSEYDEGTGGYSQYIYFSEDKGATWNTLINISSAYINFDDYAVFTFNNGNIIIYNTYFGSNMYFTVCTINISTLDTTYFSTGDLNTIGGAVVVATKVVGDTITYYLYASQYQDNYTCVSIDNGGNWTVNVIGNINYPFLQTVNKTIYDINNNPYMFTNCVNYETYIAVYSIVSFIDDVYTSYDIASSVIPNFYYIAMDIDVTTNIIHFFGKDGQVNDGVLYHYTFDIATSTITFIGQIQLYGFFDWMYYGIIYPVNVYINNKGVINIGRYASDGNFLIGTDTIDLSQMPFLQHTHPMKFFNAKSNDFSYIAIINTGTSNKAFLYATTPNIYLKVVAYEADKLTFATSGSNSFTGDQIISGSIKSNGFYINSLQTAPTSSTGTGSVGELRITSDAIYVCISDNTWVQSLLTTF